MKDDLKLLAMKVRDRITQITGVVVCISYDVSGCIQALIAPPAKDGKLEDRIWIDTKRLEVIENDPVVPQPDFVKIPGGQDLPMPR